MLSFFQTQCCQITDYTGSCGVIFVIKFTVIFFALLVNDFKSYSMFSRIVLTAFSYYHFEILSYTVFPPG